MKLRRIARGLGGFRAEGGVFVLHPGDGMKVDGKYNTCRLPLQSALLCRRRHFEKKVQKNHKLPVLYHKIKTRV